jgi:hypothetical protein
MRHLALPHPLDQLDRLDLPGRLSPQGLSGQLRL